MNILNSLAAAGALAAAAAFAVPAAAAPVDAVSIPGTPGPVAGNQSYTGPLGLDFTVFRSITLTALGAFDDDADGFAGTIAVRLYDLDDTSAALREVSVSGSGGALSGQFRYVDIAPLTLGPGSYSIVARGFSTQDRNGNRHLGFGPLDTELLGGAIAFTDSRFSSSGAFPSITTVGTFNCGGQPEACFAAGSFQYQVVPVPPAGALLVSGAGLLALCRRRRG